MENEFKLEFRSVKKRRAMFLDNLVEVIEPTSKLLTAVAEINDKYDLKQYRVSNYVEIKDNLEKRLEDQENNPEMEKLTEKEITKIIDSMIDVPSAIKFKMIKEYALVAVPITLKIVKQNAQGGEEVGSFPFTEEMYDSIAFHIIEDEVADFIMDLIRGTGFQTEK